MSQIREIGAHILIHPLLLSPIIPQVSQGQNMVFQPSFSLIRIYLLTYSSPSLVTDSLIQEIQGSEFGEGATF